jgi:putative transposase
MSGPEQALIYSYGGATSGTVPAVVGKVTPVRHECGQQDALGQEETRAHIRALS